MQLVKKADEFAVAGFTTNDVSSAMDVVNRYRIDAHAKDISQDAFTKVSAALEVLETVFPPPE
jgi:hypothetical protein